MGGAEQVFDPKLLLDQLESGVLSFQQFREVVRKLSNADLSLLAATIRKRQMAKPSPPLLDQ